VAGVVMVMVMVAAAGRKVVNRPKGLVVTHR
jgi:hypothetical protein